jgi:hypothetical protein
MKLYGKELDEELARRKEAKEVRLAERKSFRVKAKELGILPSEYFNWENGQDVCPHEEYRKSIGGVHPPFLLIKMCTKCRYLEIIAKIETEEDCDKYKDDLDEALRNLGLIKDKLE